VLTPMATAWVGDLGEIGQQTALSERIHANVPSSVRTQG
jgi:hypothetical protein